MASPTKSSPITSCDVDDGSGAAWATYPAAGSGIEVTAGDHRDRSQLYCILTGWALSREISPALRGCW